MTLPREFGIAPSTLKHLRVETVGTGLTRRLRFRIADAVVRGFMCTLSLITRDSGYLLAMNRDEKIERGAGELPETHLLHGVSVIYPSDGAAGTWISVNSYGNTFALLNSNVVLGHGLDRTGMRSRGQIIPSLGPPSSMAEVQKTAGVLDLEKTLPFRLVGVFLSEKAIGEWRWDSGQLQFQVTGGNCGIGFHRASRTRKPRIYVALYAAMRNTNRTPGP